MTDEAPHPTDWIWAETPPPPVEVTEEVVFRVYEGTLDYLRTSLEDLRSLNRRLQADHPEYGGRGDYTTSDDGHDYLGAILDLAAFIHDVYVDGMNTDHLAYLLNNNQEADGSFTMDKPVGYTFWADTLTNIAGDGIPPVLWDLKAPSLWYGPVA